MSSNQDRSEATRGSGSSQVRRTLKIVGLLTIVLALILAGREVPVVAWLERLSGSIRSLGVWGIGAYTLLYAGAAMLCLPCMPLTIAGGFILGTGAGVIAVHTGTCIAATLGFFIGRAAGQARLANWLRRSERFHFIETAVQREGWKIVALLRMHALPFGLSNYLYGMTSVPFWHYFAATAVAMLPGNIIFVHLGSIGGRISGEGGMHPLEFVLIGVGIVSLIAMGRIVTRIVKTYRDAKLAS